VLEPELIGRVDSLEENRPLVLSSAWPRRWWLNLLLFLLTFITTTIFGAAMERSFSLGQPLDVDRLWESYVGFAHGDRQLWQGLLFSAPLLLILSAHEFGHYLECRKWRVDASLPYFLPSPTLFGTLGAFIRIRSPIYSRKGLFDIGIAGPLAGFAVLLPFLIAGVVLSHPMAQPVQGPFVFGTPLVLRIFEWVRFGDLDSPRILLHPVAMAGWAGLLATAMNLLPMGQLDGGHILYAVFGERGHRLVSFGVVVLLALLGFLYWPWWFWALVTFFLFRRHPLVYDRTPLTRDRLVLCVVALLVFLLSASIVPIRAS
jgi:membrane-associated protease RseP (regulator of RpoE activity)